MEKVAKFWNKNAESYSKKSVPDEAVYQKKLKITRDYLRSDMEIVEFGCGTGSTALLHASHVKQIRASDFSPEMIKIAQKKANEQNIENVVFECSTIEALSVTDQSVDVVLALSILHLLENKEETIKKVYKMLKPGGIFISSTVCIADFMKPLKFIAPVGYFLGLLPFVKVFTKQELEISIKNAGFQIEYQWQPNGSKSKGVFIVAKKPLQ